MRKLFWLLPLAALIATSCTRTEDKVLARVGPEVIRAGDLAKRLPRTFPPGKDPLTIKREMLQSLITRKYYVAEARALGLDRDQAFKDALERRQRDLLVAALREEIVRGTKPGAAQLKEAYAQLGKLLDLELIVVEGRAQLDSVQAGLAQSVPFETLAAHFSRHPSGRQGGRIGPVPLFWIDDSLRRELEKLPVGGVSKTVSFPRGFELFRVVARRDSTLPPFKDEKSKLEPLVKQKLEAQRLDAYMAKMRARIEYNERGLELLTARAAQLTPAELETWVAKLDGKQYIKVAALVPVAARFPPLLDTGTRLYSLRREIEQDVIAQDARRRHLERSRTVRERTAQLADDLLNQRLQETQLMPRVAVTDSDVTRYYRDHRTAYAGKTLTDAESSIRSELFKNRRQAVIDSLLTACKATYPVWVNEPLLAKLTRPKEKK